MRTVYCPGDDCETRCVKVAGAMAGWKCVACQTIWSPEEVTYA